MLSLLCSLRGSNSRQLVEYTVLDVTSLVSPSLLSLSFRSHTPGSVFKCSLRRVVCVRRTSASASGTSARSKSRDRAVRRKVPSFAYRCHCAFVADLRPVCVLQISASTTRRLKPCATSATFVRRFADHCTRSATSLSSSSSSSRCSHFGFSRSRSERWRHGRRLRSHHNELQPKRHQRPQGKGARSELRFLSHLSLTHLFSPPRC